MAEPQQPSSTPIYDALVEEYDSRLLPPEEFLALPARDEQGRYVRKHRKHFPGEGY